MQRISASYEKILIKLHAGVKKNGPRNSRSNSVAIWFSIQIQCSWFYWEQCCQLANTETVIRDSLTAFKKVALVLIKNFLID